MSRPSLVWPGEGTLAKGRRVLPAHLVSASSAQPGAAPAPREFLLKGEGVSFKGQRCFGCCCLFTFLSPSPFSSLWLSRKNTLDLTVEPVAVDQSRDVEQMPERGGCVREEVNSEPEGPALPSTNSTGWDKLPGHCRPQFPQL